MIYDCFTFFNELDMLELRLHELSRAVDKFVLVEATKTHAGKPKELVYEKNKHLFQAFHSRIIHIVVDDYPDNPTGNAWVLEHHQRNAIMRALTEAKDEDIILISDVDEIPRPESIGNLQLNNNVQILQQKMYYYYFNCINTTEGTNTALWNGTIALKKGQLKLPQQLRELGMLMTGLRDHRLLHRMYFRWLKFKLADMKGIRLKFVPDAGWHFSYLGGVQRIIDKLEAFAHQEYNKPEYKNPERLKQLIANGADIFGRGFTYSFIQLDESFPSYLLHNQERFASFIFSTPSL